MSAARGVVSSGPAAADAARPLATCPFNIGPMMKFDVACLPATAFEGSANLLCGAQRNVISTPIAQCFLQLFDQGNAFSVHLLPASYNWA